jgi:DNA-binding PadR family transcriptional regulator
VGGVKYVLLAMLGPGPAHGYDLKRTYDGVFADVWGPINIGQIYVTMGRHERDGLVVRHGPPAGPHGGRSDRKLYELTELGRKQLEDWLTAPTEPAPAKSELLLRLVAAGFAGGPGAGQVIAEHRQRCLQQLRQLDRAVTTAPGALAELAFQGAALHLQAELRWLDLCDQRLESAHTAMARRATARDASTSTPTFDQVGPDAP